MKLHNALDLYNAYEKSKNVLNRYYEKSRNFLNKEYIVDKATKTLISAALMSFYSPDVGTNTRLSETLTNGGLKDTITGVIIPFLLSGLRNYLSTIQYYLSNPRNLF